MLAYCGELLPSLLEVSPYIGIFLLLTLGIWLIPFAEEIALATAGYQYYSGVVSLIPVLCVSGTGVFLGDFLAFWLGWRWGSAWLQRTFAFLESRQGLEKVSAFLDRYGACALLWVRFLPGIRLPSHILVGVHGMPIGTYLGVSLLSVAIYVPVIFTLAYSFGDEIEAALNILKRLGNAAWGLLFFVIGLWFVMRFWVLRLSPAKRKRTESGGTRGLRRSEL